MSQTIKPVKWLEAALWLLVVWDIFETTTSEVVSDEGGELWTCSLAYDIVAELGSCGRVFHVEKSYYTMVARRVEHPRARAPAPTPTSETKKKAPRVLRRREKAVGWG